MLDEIRQNGKTVLSGEDGFSIPMFFNNLCGKNFSGEKYRDYIRLLLSGKRFLRMFLTYIIHSGFISGYQNRYGDNLKPPTNVYHRMTA